MLLYWIRQEREVKVRESKEPEAFIIYAFICKLKRKIGKSKFIKQVN